MILWRRCNDVAIHVPLVIVDSSNDGREGCSDGAGVGPLAERTERSEYYQMNQQTNLLTTSEEVVNVEHAKIY